MRGIHITMPEVIIGVNDSVWSAPAAKMKSILGLLARSSCNFFRPAHTCQYFRLHDRSSGFTASASRQQVGCLWQCPGKTAQRSAG